MYHILLPQLAGDQPGALRVHLWSIWLSSILEASVTQMRSYSLLLGPRLVIAGLRSGLPSTADGRAEAVGLGESLPTLALPWDPTWAPLQGPASLIE